MRRIASTCIHAMWRHADGRVQEYCASTAEHDMSQDNSSGAYPGSAQRDYCSLDVLLYRTANARSIPSPLSCCAIT